MTTGDAPRILVFQHIEIEDPGIFGEFLSDDGITWDAVELDAGETIPDLDGYDALWVMGGPMDVWQEDEHPWLIPEQHAIREAVVDRQMPFLGVCLGHQLLAKALGGEVGPAGTPEIGVMDVAATESGKGHPFLTGIPDVYPCLQWHSAEVLCSPADALVLQSSPACRVQALAYGSHAFSIQYHVEISSSTVREWGEIPAYKTALESSLGPGGMERFESETAANIDSMNRISKTFYENFMKLSGNMRP